MPWKKDGIEFVQPLKWSGKVIYNPTDQMMTDAGWTWEDPVPEPKVRCTKNELLRCLEVKFPALFTAFRAALKANEDMKFWWDNCIELYRYDEKFDQYRTALGITDDQLDEIFAAMQETDYNLV